MTVEARTVPQLISLINKLEHHRNHDMTTTPPPSNTTTTTTFYSAVAFINKKLEISHIISLARELEKDPQGLTSLTLFNCSINDMGITLLCRALHSNTHLASLNLGQNRITNVGATNLAILLKTHPSIKHINLSFNFSIKNLGALQLLQAVEENANIVRLRLVGVPVTKNTTTKLDEQLNKNRITAGVGPLLNSPTHSSLFHERKIVKAFSFECKSTKVKPVIAMNQNQ
jgi:hypothetical protein